MLSKLFKTKRQDENNSEQTLSNELAIAITVIYLEVAWADHDISNSEISAIQTFIQKQFNDLSINIEEIIDESLKRLQSSEGLYRYTQIINSSWPKSEKYNLVLNLWNLDLINEHLDTFEEYTIRKIADLIYLDHSSFIKAKLEAKENSENRTA